MQLNRLYRQYIDRDVDEGGRVFWSNLINLGRVNIDQVGGFVISSQEFLNSVGGSANAFADSVVLRATGRARTSSDPAVPGNLLDTRLIDISGNGSIGAEDAGFTAGQLARFFYALSVNGGDGQRRLPDADRFSVTTYYALAGVAVDNDFNGFVNILQTLLFYPLDDDVVFARILAKRNS